MKYLDWKIDTDAENIREGAIELRAKTAENMYYKAMDSEKKAHKYVTADRNKWRSAVISKMELVFNKKIHGRVIEIGAGTGWCSALLSKNEPVKEVYVLDYDRYSVEVLMPMVFKNLGADESKLVPVLGSYNKMMCPDNHFDFVISIGAIHHSENLRATFSECYRALAPGGILVATEHCHPDSYTIEASLCDDNEVLDPSQVKALYGNNEMTVKAKDNSDHNYRISEFISASYFAGFDVLPFVFETEGEPADDRIFKNPQPFCGYGTRVFYPYFAHDREKPLFDNFLLILQKPVNGKSSPVFKNSNTGIQKSKKNIFSKLFKK
ncbi:MAG: class I SAM-dependent methyltransferase [Bacteroidota bacterium]